MSVRPLTMCSAVSTLHILGKRKRYYRIKPVYLPGKWKHTYIAIVLGISSILEIELYIPFGWWKTCWIKLHTYIDLWLGFGSRSFYKWKWLNMLLLRLIQLDSNEIYWTKCWNVACFNGVFCHLTTKKEVTFITRLRFICVFVYLFVFPPICFSHLNIVVVTNISYFGEILQQILTNLVKKTLNTNNYNLEFY